MPVMKSKILLVLRIVLIDNDIYNDKSSFYKQTLVRSIHIKISNLKVNEQNDHYFKRFRLNIKTDSCP